MNKYYISFGQIHTHVLDGVQIDKDSLVCIQAENEGVAREKAFKLFGPNWFTSYSNLSVLQYFPRGVVITLDA